MSSLEAGKKQAAFKAADYVEDGMTLGIGTGSTVRYLIEALAEKISAGYRLKAAATSIDTHQRAAAIGVEIIEPDETTTIDLAIDGADEADPALNLIKGGGAALLREKIIAAGAKKFIVIADSTKRVAHLGKFPLPVEIEPFAFGYTVAAMRIVLKAAGYEAPSLTLRHFDGAPIKTDGGHFVIDCGLEKIEDPASLDAALKAIPGVIDTGLFCGMADIAIFGDENGISIDKP